MSEYYIEVIRRVGHTERRLLVPYPFDGAEIEAGGDTLTKATGADINTGTNDVLYVTPKAIADSTLPTIQTVFSNAADPLVLTNAQIKALPTTGIEVIPAPGANKRLLFQRATYLMDSTAGAYDGFTATASMNLTLGAFVDASNYALLGGWWDQTQILGKYGTPIVFYDSDSTQVVENTTFDPAIVVNVPLIIKAYNSPTGDFIAGHADNTLTIVVYYSIEDV